MTELRLVQGDGEEISNLVRIFMAALTEGGQRPAPPKPEPVVVDRFPVRRDSLAAEQFFPPQSTCGIYMIEQLSTGMRYVGQSTNICGRLASHVGPYPGNGLLAKAKHAAGSIKGFTWLVLETCRPTELNALEVEWIDLLRTQHPNGFNSTRGGGPLRTDLPPVPFRHVAPPKWFQQREINERNPYYRAPKRAR